MLDTVSGNRRPVSTIRVIGIPTPDGDGDGDGLMNDVQVSGRPPQTGPSIMLYGDRVTQKPPPDLV